MSEMKASVVIDLKGNLPAEASRFTKSIVNMSESGQQRLAMLGRGVTTLSNQVDRLGNRAALGLGALGYAFKRVFIDTASQYERTAIQLEQLEGSVEKAANAFAFINKLGEKTPLTNGEVRDAYVQLKTFGLDPMNGTLQALIDMNAKMGGSSETLKGMILAVGQAWQKQKLQGEESLQLLERGVPVWDLLAKATGRNATTLMKMASAGKLGRKEIQLLIEAIGKDAAGSSEKFSRTWAGMTSNLEDHWSRFATEVMHAGTFDYLKGELSGLLTEVNKLRDEGQLSDTAKIASAELVEGLKAAKEIASGLYEVFKQVGSAAADIAEHVGGFSNLAKGLAYLYLANKALRFGGAILGGGKGLYDVAGDFMRGGKKGGKAGGSGNPLLDAASRMTPVPVYIVNAPDLPGVPGKGGKPGAPGLPGGNNKVIKPSTWRLLKNAPVGAISALGWRAAAMATGAVGAAAGGGYLAGMGIRQAMIQLTPDAYDALGKALASAWSLVSDDAQAALDADRRAQIANISLSIETLPGLKVRLTEKPDNADVELNKGKPMVLR